MLSWFQPKTAIIEKVSLRDNLLKCRLNNHHDLYFLLFRASYYQQVLYNGRLMDAHPSDNNLVFYAGEFFHSERKKEVLVRMNKNAWMLKNY